MKRKLAIAMAMFMAFSTVVPTFGEVTFKDINDMPWKGAEKFVSRAGELELMVGELSGGNRYFRAKDNVTCFETVQLVYSLLQKTDSLKSTDGVQSKWSYVMKQLGVPEWAYPSISYSLEYGIVSMTEVGKFTNSTKKTHNYASREAAAVILGKAMSDKYTLNPNASLKFKDASSVNDTSVQYVELLSRLEIFLGDNNNNFNPKVAINRAEMATIITKAYDKMKENSSSTGGNTTTDDNKKPTEEQKPVDTSVTISSGTVNAISDLGNSYLVTIIKNDGSKIGLFASGDTKVTNNGSGSATYTALSAGDVLKDIVYDGADIKSLTITYDADPGLNQSVSGTVKGTIDEFYNDVVYVNKSTGGTAKYDLDVNCEYLLDGKKATQKNIADALEDGRVDVTVTINVKGDATKLECTSKESDYTYGELKDISKSTVEIKKSGRTKTTEYGWADDDYSEVDLYLEGKTASYRDIVDAFDKYDTLYVKYVTDSKDDIKKLYASKYDLEDDDKDEDDEDEKTLEGTINDISKRYIKFKKSGTSSYKEYDFEDIDVDNAVLKINGKTYDYYDFRDMLEDGPFTATIELNKDGEVVRVVATTDDDKETSGIIKSMSSSQIAIATSSNKFDYAGAVTVSIDGNDEYDLDDLRDFVDDAYITVEADLTVKSGKVTKIEARIKEVEGELRYFNSNRGELEVRTKDRTTITFDFKSASLKVTGDEKNITDLDYYMNDKGREYDVIVEVDSSNGYAKAIDVTER